MVLVITHEAQFCEKTVRWPGSGLRGFFVLSRNRSFETCVANCPFLILLDLYLQNPSGIEVLSQLRAQGYEGKVILLAGMSVSTEIPKAFYLGVDQVIGSHLGLGQLESAIRSAIGPPSPQDAEVL